MLRRRLAPKPNHALYLPELSMVVIGRHVMVWRWQEYDFHQIQLGEFFVVVEYGSKKSVEAARSADGLLFTIRVLFEVAVDPTPAALKKATQTQTANRDLSAAITHEQLKPHLLTALGAEVADALKQLEYLSDETDFKKTLESKTEAAARTRLDTKEGFLLRRCVVLDVIPEKPSQHTLAQNPVLAEKWILYSDKLTTIETDEKIRTDEIAKAEQKRQREAKELEEKENAEAEVRRKKLINERDEQLDGEADRAETAKLVRNEAMEKRRLDNTRTKEQVKQEKTKAEKQTESFAAQETARVQTEKRTLDEQQRIAEHSVAMKRLVDERLLLEQELNLAELTLTDLRQKAAEAKVALGAQRAKELEVAGAADATVTRQKALAANAQAVQLNHELLEALPKILQAAGAPAPPTEMRVMYIAGQPGNTGASEGNLGPLLSTASSLSVLREILRFVGEWSGSGPHESSKG